MVKRQKVQVECVKDQQGKSHAPVLAYFSSADPTEGQYDSANFNIYEKGRRQIVVAEKGGISYVGRTMGSDYASGPPACRYAVGVFNRETCTLQLAQLPAESICRMEPRLPGLQYLPKGLSPQDAAEQESERAQRIAQSKRLAENFGSTRRKRQLAQREQAVVRGSQLHASAAITNVLSNAAATAASEGLTRDQLTADAAASRLIPPHNPDATTASAAYEWSRICPPAMSQSLVIGALLEAAEDSDGGRLRLQQLRDKGQVADYVLGRLELIQARDNLGMAGAEAKQKARQLAFLSALLRLMAGRRTIRPLPLEGLKRSALELGMREALLEQMLTVFYERGVDARGEVYERPDAKHALLISYILLVALLVERFAISATQYEALKAQLKMTDKQIIPRFRELGCTVDDEVLAIEEEDPDATSGKTFKRTRSHRVSLLPQNKNSDQLKTLKDSFPKLKIARAPRK